MVPDLLINGQYLHFAVQQGALWATVVLSNVGLVWGGYCILALTNMSLRFLLRL